MNDDDLRALEQTGRDLEKDAHHHLTAAELEKAVFTLDSVFTGHLASCQQCTVLVIRERERNPLYPIFLRHPDAFWEGVEEARKVHAHLIGATAEAIAQGYKK